MRRLSVRAWVRRHGASWCWVITTSLGAGSPYVPRCLMRTSSDSLRKSWPDGDFLRHRLDASESALILAAAAAIRSSVAVSAALMWRAPAGP